MRTNPQEDGENEYHIMTFEIIADWSDESLIQGIKDSWKYQKLKERGRGGDAKPAPEPSEPC